MARRHALLLLLFGLGLSHVAAASGVAVYRIVVLGDLPRDLLTADGRWLALITASGLPMLVLSLRPRHRALGRGAIARTTAAVLLLGTASAFAGLRLAQHHLPMFGRDAYWLIAPGGAAIAAGIALMPLLARQPERRASDAPDAAAPNLGPALILYVALDWIVLRLCGGGLLAMAWLLYTVHAEGGSFAPFTPVLHDQEPIHAIVAYGAAGLLIVFPFALPRALVRPGTVFSGLVKAAMIGGLMAVLLPVAIVVTELYVPAEHRDAVLRMTPSALKALAGVMILSTIVLSFFRQLGGDALDDRGRPVERIGTNELRALRVSRMQR